MRASRGLAAVGALVSVALLLADVVLVPVLFNRERYDAVGAVEAIASRLRDEIDTDTLSVDLQTLVHHTIEPAHVSLWVKPSEARQ